MEIGYLFKDNIGGIVVTATLDTRKPTSDETYRLSIRVAHNREKHISNGKGSHGRIETLARELKENFLL